MAIKIPVLMETESKGRLNRGKELLKESSSEVATTTPRAKSASIRICQLVVYSQCRSSFLKILLLHTTKFCTAVFSKNGLISQVMYEHESATGNLMHDMLFYYSYDQ